MSQKVPLRFEIVEAIVHTADDEIPYRRAGRGRPTLLLCEGERPDHASLFLRLAALGLVVEPLVLPERSGMGDWTRWLRGIVDGLGLDRPDLVVSARLADAVRPFLEEDPHRGGSLRLVEELEDCWGLDRGPSH